MPADWVHLLAQMCSLFAFGISTYTMGWKHGVAWERKRASGTATSEEV